MAPDEVQFLILLYVIYLSDCFMVPRSSALVLYSRFRDLKLRVKSTDASSVFSRRFWLLRPLLPPLGFSRCLEFSRCAFSATGFCSISSLGAPAWSGEDVKHILYDDVELIEIKDQELIVNGERWFKGKGLDRLKENLEAIMRSPDRESAVRTCIQQDFLRGENAGEAIREIESRMGWLNAFCSLYFFALLLYLPAVLFRFPPFKLLWAVGVPLLLIHIFCGILFLGLHVRMVEEGREHRWESFFKMFLCPPMMIRACDVLADHVPLHGDAVSILMSATDEKVWLPVARTVWRRLMPHDTMNLPEDVSTVVSDHADAYRIVFASELRKKGVEIESLEINETEIPEGQRFCPRCEALYRDEIKVCADCGGVPLVARKEKTCS